MKDKGDVFIHLPTGQKAEWVEFLKAIAADWVKEQAERGLPGQEILDAALQPKKKYSEQSEI